MENIYWILFLVFAMFISFLFTRNDRDENNSFTKKGFIKLMIIISILFISVVIFYSMDFIM
ncbi:DUF3976 domain-containing protein [Bacillus sp. Bva_UNVM-123]|uniref:hypothetical protein n=1 Tax=Bacillus sp. Bva_UNVM-123 TaxID=2829798 RepID=UPI00391EFD51